MAPLTPEVHSMADRRSVSVAAGASVVADELVAVAD